MISKTDFPRAPQSCEFRKTWITVVLCAVGALGLHRLLPVFAAGLSQAEPSFAGEVFPWVSIPTQATIEAAHATSSHAATSLKFIAVCAGLFAICGVMLWVTKGVESFAIQAFIFCSGAAFLISYIFAPVMQSTDVFAYAMYGRAMSVFGGNPYDATMPVPDTDPFYILFSEEYLPSWYGPLWTFISAGATWWTGEHLGATVLVFRLIAILSALIASGFIWSCLRKCSPENTARGLVLFLWNPLLVTETGLSGHNDATMMALVLCGVWLHLRGHKAGAVMALTLSALVKFLTGMLVPLYLLLVLRESKTWRERGIFLLRSAIPACAVVLLAFHLAKADGDVPVARSATAPGFYLNNFHELIFQRLRTAVGEEAESAKVSVHFYPYWLRLRDGTDLRGAKSASAPVLRRVEGGEHLLLIAPDRTDWLRVYDPKTRQKGYFTGAGFDESKRPALADNDAVARELEKPVMEHQTVRKANAIVRLVTWLGFAAFGLFAAWRTVNFTQFVVWSAASLLASYYFIITEIWPWYVNWALALAALAPGRLPARLAMILSACVLTLYVTLGCRDSGPEWVFRCRSILAFVLPLAVFIVLVIVQRRKPSPHVQPG